MRLALKTCIARSLPREEHVQIKELQAQKTRLEGLFEDSCAKRQHADARSAQLRRQLDAEKAGRAKQVGSQPLNSDSEQCQVQASALLCWLTLI